MELRAGRLLVMLALWMAAPASAQHGFVPPPDRPLHERLAAARIVAFATVVAVEPGRVAFEAPAAVRGALPPGFEVKRAPSAPPPWGVGERALLLLSGARSPYRWVEKPVEAITPADAEDEARWHAALRAMDSVREDPPVRRDLYARWCDGDAAGLAAAGLRGLTDVPGMAGVVDEGFARARAAVALDASRPIAARRRAARVAVRHPAGVEVLLADFLARGPEVDVQIAELTLQAAMLVRSGDAEAGIIEALAEPGSELGVIGMRLATLARGAAVEQRLSELAVGHPDADVRNDAVRALKRLRGNRDGDRYE